MTRRATLTYSEPIVAQAVLAYWRRSVGMSTLVAAALVIAIMFWLILSGDRSWLLGLVVAAAILVVTFPLAIYKIHYRNSVGKLRAMQTPQADFVAEDDTFTLSSDQGSTTLKWTSVTELWRFESFWLMLFSKAQFVTIPLVGVPDEFQTFVLERAKAAGAKIAA
jgi:hypothetical protein